VTSPKLLLLDEPFSGIDPIAVYEVQKIVRRLKERGLGILITDHNVRETLKLIDRGYIIHKGQVLVEGSRNFWRTTRRRARFIWGRNLICEFYATPDRHR
jgi:lipopolysaccharide export system ATP-binding protein